MNSEDKQPRTVNDRSLRGQAAKLRELNERLLIVAERFAGKIPEDLEELDELLERKFGPDLWKGIYDEIPGKNDKDGSLDKDTSIYDDDKESPRK